MSSLAGSSFAAIGAPLLLQQLGRSVVRRIRGDAKNVKTITAIVDWSEELGTNQKDGDGVALPNAKGERVRSSCRVTVLSSQEIHFGHNGFDVIEADGVLINIIRPAGRDDGLRDYIGVNVEGVSTHGGRPRY